MERSASRYLPYSLLAFSILLGAFLRFYHIGSQPLWLDEAYSYWFSSRTLFELWTVVPQYEPHPPLYYTILKAWSSLGSTEAWLRSLSALVSIACIPLVFMLGRLLGKSCGGDWIGTGAAFLFAVSPVHVQFAQEARPYAMLTLAATAALCGPLWLMRHPEEASKPIFRRLRALGAGTTNGPEWPRFLAWATTVLGSALTLWLHPTSILYVGTLWLIFLLWPLRDRRADKLFLLNAAIAGLVVFVLWAPVLVFLVHHTRNVVASFWIPKPTVLSALSIISWVLFGNSPFTPTAAKAAIKIVAFSSFIGIASAGLWHIRKRSDPYISVLILGVIAAPILMTLLFSVMVTPILLARTLIYVSVPFYVAIIAGVMALRDSRMRAVVLIAVSLMFVKWTYDYYRDYRKEPWDQIAHRITREARNDIVLFVPNGIEIPFSYYAKSIGHRNFQSIPIPHSYPTNKVIQPADIPQINDVIAKSSSVIWLISRFEDLFDRDRIVFNTLMQNRALISEEHLRGINVYKFGGN